MPLPRLIVTALDGKTRERAIEKRADPAVGNDGDIVAAMPFGDAADSGYDPSLRVAGRLPSANTFVGTREEGVGGALERVEWQKTGGGAVVLAQFGVGRDSNTEWPGEDRGSLLRLAFSAGPEDRDGGERPASGKGPRTRPANAGEAPFGDRPHGIDDDLGVSDEDQL